MGLSELKKEILDKARLEAESIVKSAKEEEKMALKDAEKRSKEIEDQQIKEISDFKESYERRESALASSEAKKMLMLAKKEMIQHVFEQARKEISLLDDSEKEKTVKKLLKEASMQMEVKYVYCRSHDLKFIPSSLVALEKPMTGGIIVENSDRSIRIDYSFDRMLEEIEQENVQEIQSILFEK